MRRLLRLFGIHVHDWDKWSDPEETEGRNLAQRRRCLSCNFVQDRIIIISKRRKKNAQS